MFGVLVFRVKLLFESYFFNHYSRVVTPLDSLDLQFVTAGVPQGQ